MRSRIKKIREKHIEVVNRFFEENYEKLENIVSKMEATIKEGGKILIAGNGGSTADALHMSAELIGRFYKEREPIPAIALPSNPSILTEIGNDYDFRYVFKRQIEGLGKKGDIFIAISTSGNSENIIEGLKVAKEMGIYTIGLSGESGGKMRDHTDICLCVPSLDTPRIQEVHIMIIHILCEFLEERLYGDKNGI